MASSNWKPLKEHVDIIEYTKIGMTEGVKEMIKMGEDVNEKDADGWCAVVWAAYRNDMEILKLLVENGAKLDVRGGCGFTPLSYARSNYNQEMCDYIIAHLEN